MSPRAHRCEDIGLATRETPRSDQRLLRQSQQYGYSAPGALTFNQTAGCALSTYRQTHTNPSHLTDSFESHSRIFLPAVMAELAVGILSLALETADTVKSLYTAFQGLKSAPGRAQRVKDDCERLTVILRHIQAITRLNLTAHSLSTPLIDLRGAVLDCQDELKKARIKIKNIQAGKWSSVRAKIKATLNRDFFPELHQILSSQRENLSLLLGVLVA